MEFQCPDFNKKPSYRWDRWSWRNSR